MFGSTTLTVPANCIRYSGQLALGICVKERTGTRQAKKYLSDMAALRAEAPAPALVALVREWQEARKPATLSAPGEFLAETFQAAVRRMSAADEALAAYRLDVGRACFLCDGTGNEGDEKIGDVDCHGCGGAGRVLPSLREELTEIIRWRFKTADGAPMNGPLVLKRAQEIANEIAPHIEEAVGEP